MTNFVWEFVKKQLYFLNKLVGDFFSKSQECGLIRYEKFAFFSKDSKDMGSLGDRTKF